MSKKLSFFCLLGVVAALVTVLPASAQQRPTIDILDVDYPACTPGEYPRITYETGNDQDLAWISWTLTNLRTGGSFTTLLALLPFGNHQYVNSAIPTPVPAGTEPGDTLALEGVVSFETEIIYDTDQVSWTCVAAEVEPVPGCDTQIMLPSWAVGGTFTQTVQVFWKPGELTIPPVIIDADKTAWVLGRDTTGGYYKFLWACDLLWTPVSTMGPNYDAVWLGKPLPTQVVD